MNIELKVRKWSRGHPVCIVIEFTRDITNEEIEAIPRALMTALHGDARVVARRSFADWWNEDETCPNESPIPRVELAEAAWNAARADVEYAQRSREVLAFIAKFAQQMCQEDSPDPREWHDDMNYIAVIAERGTISDDQRQGADSPYVATIDPSEAQTSMAASNKTPPSPAIPAGDAHSTVRPGHPDVPVTGHIQEKSK